MIRVLKENGVIIIEDLMFESKEAEEQILKRLSQKQIEEIKDEYYSYIDLLSMGFNKYNKKLDYKRIDQFNYLLRIK